MDIIIEKMPTNQLPTHQLQNDQLHNDQLPKITNSIDVSKNVIKPKTYKNIMKELMKPPPKEEKLNIHLSGGGVFKKLDKI